MMKERLLELENFLFKSYANYPIYAAHETASIFGVIIGVKPTAIISNIVRNGQLLSANRDFRKLITQNGLIMLTGFEKSQDLFILENPILENSIKNHVKGLMFLSKNREHCLWLREELQKALSVQDEMGDILVGKEKIWSEASTKVGELLGYPNTAVLEWVKAGVNKENTSKSFRKRVLRSRYYVYSENFENIEYEKYDLPLNLAINQYLPQTAKVMQSEHGKRWLG